MDSEIYKPRRPWLAALLSLCCGPIGQVYCGRFRRSILLWTIGGILWPVGVFIVITSPIGRYLFWPLFSLAFLMPCYFALDAYRLAIMHRYEPLKRYQRWWFYVLVLIGFSFAADYTVLLIRTAVAEMFVVPGRAMWPTIKHNDRIVVDKFWKDVSNVKRGDVVVVYREGPSSELVNLRVVALPGDTVEIKDEQLILNGLEVIERYAELKGDKPLYIPKLINQDPVTIPAGSFYVLGDNRRFALDSRLLGPIPFADFYGFPSVIYWSRDYEFHGADEYSEGTPGRIRWDRIGTRLD